MTDSGEAELPTLAQRLLQGDKRAVARAITLIERDQQEGWDVVREVYPHTGGAAVVGFTGPPGAGKSTLLDALTTRERARDHVVSVLSIDPSSPLTNGAVLGDRVRLARHFLDPGVFIRSMASRGALGGLSTAAFEAILLMDAAGADVILVETVGVGQAEVQIADQADTVVLVLMPGSGDSIQALKAGVLEIPDVIVVNKSDQPHAEAFARELQATLALGPRGGWPVPVIQIQALTGTGVDELLRTLDRHREFLSAEGLMTERRNRRLRAEIVGLAVSRLHRRLEAAIAETPETVELVERVIAGELDPASAAEAIVRAVGNTIE